MQNLSIEGFQFSPQQKRLWLLQQDGARQSYISRCAILIEGELKSEILELALQKVVERHEILRTTFQALKGMNIPLQVINDNTHLKVDHHDLVGLDPEQQTAEVENLFQEQTQLCFDLQNSSVLNISLISLSPQKYILLIAIPALYADSVSLNNLLREFSYAYTACLQEKELVAQPLQYADIAAWQNELFEGEDAETGREYWRNQKLSSSLASKLPNEKQPVGTVFKPKFITLDFDSDTVGKLIALVRKNANASASNLLLACWQILLWRHTGQPDIAIGMCCDGRNYEELEPSIGLLAKYLPVQGCLDEELKFSEILKQVDKATSDVYQWQESFNWEDLLGEIELSKKLSFFPFCFDFVSQPTKYFATDVSFSIQKQYTCIDRFKVKLSCLRRDDSLTAELHYDANLFGKEDIQRLAAQFQTLLASAIDNPETAIAQLEILGPIERQQLLAEFNNTQTDYPKHQCIHQLFEHQAARTPGHLAIVFENQQLTYAQLNARANQLAHHLQTLGVGPETIVALCVERSLEMLIGLLGILKAGGAYLPLDPLLPTERLAFMLQDAGASVILTQQHLAERFSKQAALIVCLDTQWDAIAEQQDENPPSEATPENLVYVVYTSGSTGKPKGVAVEHQQLLNYLHSILERLDLPEGSSFATVSTFAADLGNTVIFPALCTGGRLHVISQERATNPEALADYCDRHPIDCLKIVPSHLNALLAASSPEKILPRQRLILGGEVLSWNLVEKLQQYKPSCQIFNHYGPTEATVGVLTYPIKGEPIGDKCETVPLGRPIANTQVYILDTHLRPVPIGVPGELYVGGDCLARGYLNQPELTTERFIRNPFTDESGARLYKTGDLARYLSDGNTEFLGRIDYQVKIHGFRIELGEISSVLGQHPAIREAVVIAREDEPGNKRLVAYVVSNREQAPEIALFADLRNFLKERLPEYMIPSAFVRLLALPLTPNGKVDRQALPVADIVRPELEGIFVAPRTPIEATIAGIWTSVLGLEQVGIHDNFFELGGDSILSIQIVARANQAGLQLVPKQLFEYPTIAELAAVAGTAPSIQAEQEPVTGLVPLTPIQHWFFGQNLPHPHHWNQALLLEVRQAISPTLLKQAVQHLRSHHDALRLQFTPKESGWQQVIAGLDEEVPFLQVDLSALPESEQGSALETAAGALQASLNLEEGQLMRVALFDLGDNQPHRLLLVIHHLAVDGVSWRILLADLETAYQQLSGGETIQLPPKTTSFKQWSYCIQEYAQSAKLQQERDYWLAEPRRRVSCLPVDFPEQVNTVASARTVSVALSVQETRTLLQEVPTAYRTQINDVLLTALVQAFAHWTGTRCLLVDLEGHGREEISARVDLSRTVGWFTTIFPVLLDLGEACHPGEALKAVKQQLRSIPNRGIDYGVLRYLASPAELQGLPQAEVRFNYLGQSDQVLSESSLFELAQEPCGPTRSMGGSRSYLLDINGIVAAGCLRLDWTYSEQVHNRSTIESLAQGFVSALRSLIVHCHSPEAGYYTPSDFPKAQLNQKDLDQFLARINRASERKPQ
jgi:amino acid adenylation domain-containing protein/non-ribosomal peptide synthase protein (TIGR01720 family)